MTAPIVVVGGGLAAGTTVTALRENGYTGDLVLYTDEPHPPYERPPLSKEFLRGEADASATVVNAASWYEDHDVDLRTGTAVTDVDPDAHTVTAGGVTQRFSKLLLATGVRARHLAMVDDAGIPATYLRTLADAEALRHQLLPGRRIAIVGGGWIGLEVAASARQLGCEVVVLEVLDQPLLRVLGTEVAASFAGLHREQGVDLRTGTKVSQVDRTGDAVRITLGDGSTVEADHLVVGVGVTPATELAQAAGIATDNGIPVDAGLRTPVADVFAAGDVAAVDHPVLGHRVRVEHWDTAIQHGRVAATNLAGGSARVEALPYFFTDQYDLGMEYVGHASADAPVIVRGNLDGSRVFTAFWVDGERVLAGMHANDWDAIGDIRRLVGERVDLDALASGETPLADVAARA